MADETIQWDSDFPLKENPSYDDAVMIMDKSTGKPGKVTVESLQAAAGNNVIGAALPTDSPSGTEENGQSYRVSNKTGAVQTFPNFLDKNGDPVEMAADERSGYLIKNADGWAYSDNTSQTDTSDLVEKGGYEGTAADLDNEKASKADYISKADGQDGVDKSNQAFNLTGTTPADPYETCAPNNYIGGNYGISFPVGPIALPFDTVTIKGTKGTATVISEIEVRVFVESPDGELLGKKRISVSDLGSGVTSILKDVQFDSVINKRNIRLWVQILMDGPFNIARLSPAAKFTPENGYSQPSTTSTNDLDGIVFENSIASSVDIYLKFNQFQPTIEATAALNKIISDANARIAAEDQISYPSIANAYLQNGVQAASANWRLTDYIPVKKGDPIYYKGNTTLSSGVANAVTFFDTDKENYSILLDQIDASSEHIIPAPASGYVRMCATVSSGNTFSFRVGRLVIESSQIVGNIPVDYDQATKTIHETWNAVGHSIWYQDGRPYTQGDIGAIAVGIQTHVRRRIFFDDYHNYSYSGNSLGKLNESDTNSILAHTSGWVAAKIWTYDSITNDFKRNIPIGTKDDFLNRTGALTYYGALRELHEIMTGFNKDYICICANALQRNNGGYDSFFVNTVGATLQDYEDALLWVRNRLSWRFVDQFRDSGIRVDNATVPSNLLMDGLHPNDLGYQRIAPLWIREMLTL